MKNRAVKLLATGVSLLCLTVTPAWAQLPSLPPLPVLPSPFQNFCAQLNGVDRCGNLDRCNSSSATFTALVNTCNGKAIGTATGCVKNCSNLPQVYVNGCFGSIRCINVCTSVYSVLPNGKALLSAIGQVDYCCDKGEENPV